MNVADAVMQAKEREDRNMMELRLLNEEEHSKTRVLWEEVFSEDTKAFLDYYYFIKTRDNKIYVMEDEDGIHSMIHLNPYKMRIEDSTLDSNYIVAVATQKPYRKRGYMGALLRRCIEDMYEKKMPFAFLMPAAEAIYTPYDFRYIYRQPVRTIRRAECLSAPGQSMECGGSHFTWREAGLWDADDMAEFFGHHFADRYQVCAVHDAAYYRTMIMEQQSEQGGVMLLYKDGEMRGMFAYGAEEDLEIRELLSFPEDRSILYSAIESIWRTPGEEIHVAGCLSEEAEGYKPMIMARIICLQSFLQALKTSESVNMECSFAVIDPLAQGNSKVWRLESRQGRQDILVRECEDSEGVIPVADLTEFFFGCCTVEELEKRENVILSERLKQEIQKIIPLKWLFLNEIV